jgi:branched-chain amino acid transport system permease protein
MIPPRILVALFIAALLAATAFLSESTVNLIVYIGLASIVTLGLTLLVGAAGLTSLGHAAFVGVGAYATALLTTYFGQSAWIGLAGAIAVTWLVALVLGAITLRLSGPYFVLGTIAWGVSIYIAFGNSVGLGGYNGISDLPPPHVFGVPINGVREFSIVTWGVVLVIVLFQSRLLNSRPGRAIRTLQNRRLAEAFGIDVYRLKLAVFTYSALLAGISGWLHAHYLRFVNPSPFGIHASIDYIFMIVMGGVASLWGGIVGAGTVMLLKSWVQDLLSMVGMGGGQFELLIFSVIVIAILHHSGSGLAPFFAQFIVKQAPARLSQNAAPLSRRAQPPKGELLLEVDGVRKQFGGLTAVNDVSFSMRAGEIVGLIGPNGAGKTTLFNLISGVLSPTEGQIRFCGIRIDTLPAGRRIHLGLARTFQIVQLRPTMTALENVAVGAHIRGCRGLIGAPFDINGDEEASLLREAMRKLDRVGLAEIGPLQAGSLPLGQQRIVEIARALAGDPILIMLDEPCAGLRYQEKQEFVALMRSLRAEGISVLIVEHDMDVIMDLVDRAIVLDFGRVICDGPPLAVQRDEKVIQAYLGT